jgi:hypothetical protein
VSKRLVLAIAGSTIAAFAIGFSAGNRWTHSWMRSAIENEVANTAGLHLESLLLLRSGETLSAIGLLDHQVDSAVVTLPQGRDWAQLPPSTKTTLLIAKHYRRRHPSPSPRPPVAEALASVPDEPLDPNSCRPAIGRLLADS